MKALVPVLFLVATSVARAEVTISRSELQNSHITLNITGSDARDLKNLLGDNSIRVDLQNSKDIDNSDIRYLRCGADSCEMVLSSRVYTNKDADHVFSEDFKAELLALDDSQVLLSPHVGVGLDGPVESKADSLFLRLLMDKSREVKEIRVSRKMPSNLKGADDLVSNLYKLSFNTKNISFTCHSSIVTGMGDVNFLNEGCSVEAVAQVK